MTAIDHLIDTLNQNVHDVTFFYAFPNREFTVPLCDSYECSVTALSEKNPYTQKISYELELVAPLKFSGKEVFDKANDICRCLMNTEKNITCRIQDMTYLKLKRCYCLKITAVAFGEYFQDCTILFAENSVDGVITSQKVKYHSCDIMVYGMTKPFDTLLENCVYQLEIQSSVLLPKMSDFTVTCDTDNETVCYTKCKVNYYSVRNIGGADVFLYDITACERNVIL